MTLIAATDIRHGTAKGETIVFAAGEEIKDLDKETIETLKLSGAVYEPSKGEDLTPEEREAKKARLRAELVALEGAEGVVPATPGNAAEALAKQEAVDKLVASGKSHDEAVKQVEADAKKAAEAAK